MLRRVHESDPVRLVRQETPVTRNVEYRHPFYRVASMFSSPRRAEPALPNNASWLSATKIQSASASVAIVVDGRAVLLVACWAQRRREDLSGRDDEIRDQTERPVALVFKLPSSSRLGLVGSVEAARPMLDARLPRTTRRESPPLRARAPDGTRRRPHGCVSGSSIRGLPILRLVRPNRRLLQNAPRRREMLGTIPNFTAARANSRPPSAC